MTRRTLMFALMGGLTALLFGCATVDEEEKPAPVPQGVVLAQVSSAKKVSGPRRTVEISGMLPGPGWIAQVQANKRGGSVDLRVIAVPGPGATQGSAVPFTTTYQVTESGRIRVFDQRNIQIKRID